MYKLPTVINLKEEELVRGYVVCCNKFRRNMFKNVINRACRHCSQLAKVPAERQTAIPTKFVNEDGQIDDKAILETILEQRRDESALAKPSFNFAAYVNKSETLQQLVKLGVDLYQIERRVKAVPFVLGLKFDDVKPHLLFFKDLGLENDEIAHVITKNPFVLKEDVDNLQVRLNYLEYKRFTRDMMLRIVRSNPMWLSHSTEDIDKRLGFFQKNFALTGDEVRFLTTSRSKLITYDLEKVKLNIFVVKEEMGFSPEEMKTIILNKPAIFSSGQNRLLQTFEYLHGTMKIPHHRLAETPAVLTCRRKILAPRHQFLVKLGRDQFDPKKPNYVSLLTIVSGTDAEFATETAKSSVQAYNDFLKTL